MSVRFLDPAGRGGEPHPRGICFHIHFFQTFLKRLSDLGLILIVLPIAVPLMLGLSVLIRQSGPGPLVLRLTCIGENGRSFAQYRFRSVYIDARARQFRALMCNETVIDGRDPRLTPIGEVMLSCGLNRLPQILNILKGEMSFFGPAPVVLAEAGAGISRG